METSIVYQNPHASEPLHVGVDLICNTPEEKVLQNVLINSRQERDWIKLTQAHDGIAVICGSAPSLADKLQEIKARQANCGIVFALNGAANYLASNGCLPDYQIIMDAQPRTIEVVGAAKKHLLASQVDPSLFGKLPKAILWHATYGELDVTDQDGFPVNGRDICLIGGFSSVGVTALILLYAMGYRKFHIYGMDSSQAEGKTHVVHQAINDDDLHTVTEFMGKRYISSLTMKAQADSFMARARDLINNGCTIEVHGYGLLPDMWNNPPKTEKEKYELMWERSAYRTFSPGEHIAAKFLEIVDPHGLVIDYGCGTGRGGLAISKAGHPVILTDFTENSRDIEALDLPFCQIDLTQPIPLHSPYGFCTDVMEHLPEKDVLTVLKNITDSSAKVFFQISTVPDTMGALIGQDLHLTVKPHEWWVEQFMAIGCKIEWQEKQDIASLFVVVKEAE